MASILHLLARGLATQRKAVSVNVGLEAIARSVIAVHATQARLFR
jgi:hypothetical protein